MFKSLNFSRELLIWSFATGCFWTLGKFYISRLVLLNFKRNKRTRYFLTQLFIFCSDDLLQFKSWGAPTWHQHNCSNSVNLVDSPQCGRLNYSEEYDFVLWSLKLTFFTCQLNSWDTRSHNIHPEKMLWTVTVTRGFMQLQATRTNEWCCSCQGAGQESNSSC